MKKCARFTFVVLTLLLSAAMLSANGQQEDADAQVELTVWDFKYGEVDGMQPPMIRVDEMFMERYANVSVNHVAQPGEVTQYYNVIRAAATSQSGPDVVMFHGGRLAWDFNEIQVPLDDYIADWRNEISEFSWEAASFEGDADNPVKLVPITTQGLGFYYDKTMFEEAGLDPEDPPNTPEKFFAAAEALQEAGFVPITTGFSPNNFFSWFSRVMLTNAYPGAEELEAWRTGEANFTDEPFVRGVEFLDTLLQNGYFHPDAPDIPIFMDALNLYKQGEGAMFLGLLSDIAHWKDFADGRGQGTIGYFPTINFPGDSVQNRQYLQGVGIGYGIMDWSENKDVAANYVEMYGRDAAPVMMDMIGALHPNNSVDFAELGYPILDEITPYLQNGVPGLNQYIPTAADTTVRQLSQGWFLGEMSADEFIVRAQRSLENERAAE
jgi:ABC-type glycerol-3-phosphate transport system substrate-binding protein